MAPLPHVLVTLFWVQTWVVPVPVTQAPPPVVPPLPEPLPPPELLPDVEHSLSQLLVMHCPNVESPLWQVESILLWHIDTLDSLKVPPGHTQLM